MPDISKVVMQRTLDVILTTANFKSAHDGVETGGESAEGNGNTVAAKSCGTSQNEAVEHLSFLPGLRVVWKGESFNGITDGKSRDSCAKQR